MLWITQEITCLSGLNIPKFLKKDVSDLSPGYFELPHFQNEVTSDYEKTLFSNFSTSPYI
nr:unnamed protein product [Callosobruchus analis]